MTTLVPVISDIQYPLHDPAAVDLAAQIIEDLNVDSFCVGDELDNWEISRWARGFKDEYDGLLGGSRDGVGDVLKRLRVKDISRSNHGEKRLETYLAKNAPALAELPELRYERFMRYEERGITFHRYPYEIAPGWLMCHGDEGSLIQSAGGTAMNIAKKWGMSIVSGHTHRLGLQHHHIAFGGEVRRELWGFEVGNLMDMKKALYLPGGYGNWQQGIGVLAIDGDNVTPISVPFHNGRAYFDGRTYRA